jgi:23S rRNA pseudouridine1911/1915/1917 synthase
MNERQAAILFEDDEIVVVNKPAGMIVHPAPGHTDGALTDWLVARCPRMATVGSAARPGVVHRLDIETSGVMVFAKTQAAYRKLRAAFESHRDVAKTYLAVLHGAPSPAQGRIETRMGRKPWDARRMAADVPGGVRAVTRWHVLARRGALALVRFDIETGRMHQIRVHAAHLGHPIAGDSLYGDQVRDRRMARPPSRPLLHAVEITFPHPASRRMMTFAAEPPADIIYAR